MYETMNLEDALKQAECPVLIRRIWANTNSSKDQYTVQLIQKVNVGNTVGTLVSITQGIESGQKVTALLSFSKSQLELFDLPLEADYTSGDAPIAESVFSENLAGQAFNIEITESFNPNPKSSNHEPKMNPELGEIVHVNEQPVYRHTEVVVGETDHQFVRTAAEALWVEEGEGRKYPTGLQRTLDKETAGVTQSEPALASDV